MRVRHKPLTNQTDHLKTYLFFSNPLTLISIILLVTMIGCKCNCNKPIYDDDDSLEPKEKKPLKFQLTAPAKASSKTAYKIGPNEDLLQDVADDTEADLFKLTIDVIEGDDELENYRFNLVGQGCFKTYFTGGLPDLDDWVTLSKPTYNSTLKDAELGSSLKKGDKKEMSFSFKGSKGKGSGNPKIKMARSAQADLEIVDKAGNSVSNKVTLYWYTDEA